MKRSSLAFVALAIVMLAGCAAGPNPVVDTVAADGNIAGFWLGLWHGAICPVTFFVSLFSDTVYVYEVYNSGAWYDFGFMIGAGAILGSAH